MRSYYSDLDEWLNCFAYVKTAYGHFLNNKVIFGNIDELYKILHNKVFYETYDHPSINTMMQDIFPFEFIHRQYETEEDNFKNWYRAAEKTESKVNILRGINTEEEKNDSK